MAEAAAVVIRHGDAAEGARLKEIAIASKAHCGYDLERVRDGTSEWGRTLSVMGVDLDG